MYGTPFCRGGSGGCLSSSIQILDGVHEFTRAFNAVNPMPYSLPVLWAAVVPHNRKVDHPTTDDLQHSAILHHVCPSTDSPAREPIFRTADGSLSLLSDAVCRFHTVNAVKQDMSFPLEAGVVSKRVSNVQPDFSIFPPITQLRATSSVSPSR